MYEHILTEIPHADIGKPAWVIYSLSSASILKMLGRLDDALNTVDHVVQKAPFYVQARIQRSTLLALMGNPGDGLAGIESIGSTAALGQWILEYVRGLILLKLHRFEDARQQLVEKMNRTLEGGESGVLLRVGAAIVFLIGDQIAQAESVIAGVGAGQEYYERYLLHVVRLHIAVVADDQERVRAILAALEASGDCDRSLTAAVYELKLAAHQDSKRERLTRALNHQVDFLLRAA
jgi:hypothetical protein